LTVETPTSAVLSMRNDRKLPRALMGGTSAMRNSGSLYLPKELAESDASYKIRLERSFLFNGFAKTVRDMTGKVFAKPIAIGDDVPPDIAGYAENIDLAGRNLDVFASDVFEDALADGIGYILVEMDPPAVDAHGDPIRLTKADEISLNRRPWLVHIKADDMIGWRKETVGGVERLVQVRFYEQVTEPDGEFDEQVIQQIRVFKRSGDSVSWEVWRQDVALRGAWGLYQSGTITINEIALCPVYVNRTGFMRGKPPLLDLAYVNMAHWQSQSDQRNILHVARVPILFGSGWTPESPVEIGASRMLTSSDTNAKLAYVEHSGAAIDAGRQDLKDLEFQMQALGLELLVPRSGSTTATGEAIDQAKMSSTLAMMAFALKDALEQAFGFMALYAGLNRDSGGGSLTVNTDFGVSLRGAQDITSIIEAMKNGLISRETGIRELKRRGFLSDDIDEEEEVKRALDDSMPIDDAEDEAFNVPNRFAEAGGGSGVDTL
jgi:hypothetical protein